MSPPVHVQAILSKQRAETLSSVLYPDDRTYEGKELRLKQQYFFVSATIQVNQPRLTPCNPRPAPMTCAHNWSAFVPECFADTKYRLKSLILCSVYAG